jgi:hypothetical protein
MRALGLAVVAGCSFQPGIAPSATPGDARGSADGAIDARRDAPPDATPAPFALTGMRWLIPCTGGTPGGPTSCGCARTSPAYTQMVTLAGSAGEHWLVTVEIAGAMEGLTYGGGVADASSRWYTGGGTNGDNGDNYYELVISSPSQHYYLNNGPSGLAYSVAEQYTVSFPIDGDATVMFVASPQDSAQWQGVDSSGQEITISGYTAPAAVNGQYGQWAYLTVKSATPQ